ncbi:MAG: LysR family transcriptional regulator [Lachnospiraceae bacterium]|nr:LysR family transcriptional regulator [Lachnospiraceae bacterium]
MDINYELYKVFYYVASSLSFSEASKALYISQSAVSQSIKTLEKKLGQPLFYRTTKKVSLTPAGQLLMKHIEPAINLIHRGEETLADDAAMQFGQLHIGASDTICRYFLVPYLEQFHKAYPQVPIRITNATSYGCVELLEHGKVDLILVNYPNASLAPSYITQSVAEFCDVFVGNPEFFDFPDKALTLKEISQYPLLMLDRKSTTSDYLHKLFLKHQLELIPDVQLSSNDLLIDLSRIGLGIAFVPDYCIREREEENSKDKHSLHILPLTEAIPTRRIVAATDPTLPQNSSVKAFLELLPNLNL